MRFLKLLSLTFIALPLLVAQAPPNGDEYWPKEMNTANLHLVLYQPQVDSWKGNRIEARSAVIVTLKGDTTQIFGTVSISARTEVDKERGWFPWRTSASSKRISRRHPPCKESFAKPFAKVFQAGRIPCRSTGSWRTWRSPKLKLRPRPSA